MVTTLIPIDRNVHSEVGASGRQRWSVCARSVAFIRKLPKGKSSVYAQWGNDAHDHSEKALNHIFFGAPKPAKIKDPEMSICVLTYLGHIAEVMEQHAGEEYRAWVEARFTLPDMPEAYGTVDFAVYFPRLRLLYVIDLKTGGGHVVHSEENVQLLYYATALMFQEHLAVERAVLAISAPRAPEDYQWKPWEVTGLRLFQELGKLRAEILATKDPNAPLVSGDHCAKSFCPAMADCPARREEAYALAVADFTPVELYDTGHLVDAFLKLDRIRAWCSAVDQRAHGLAFSGLKLPGLKLVDKRLGNRKWKDEKVAAEKLAGAGPSGPIFKAPELLSPAQVEKVFPKGSKAMIAGLVTRESTGTTLVPESDDRPEASLTGDFAAVTSQKEDGSE